MLYNISITDWLYKSFLILPLKSLLYPVCTTLWVGFGGFLGELPLLLSLFSGVWTLGLSLALRCLHYGCTYIHTCCLWWHWQLFIWYNSLLQHQPVLPVVWHHQGWIPYRPWECSHLVWISLWLVAIGWFGELSVATLATGVGAVVISWH